MTIIDFLAACTLYWAIGFLIGVSKVTWLAFDKSYNYPKVIDIGVILVVMTLFWFWYLSHAALKRYDKWLKDNNLEGL